MRFMLWQRKLQRRVGCDAHSAESQESIRAKRCLCSQGSHALRKEGLQLQVSRGVWGMNDAILRSEVGVRV
jgi:hypothetical protein